MNWEYFTTAELMCKCGCKTEKMDACFMSKLIALRKNLGFAFIIDSGYRCANHNRSVSITGENGPHTTGRAVDIQINGERAYALVRQASQFGIHGIGIQQAGKHEYRFIHLDDLTVKDGFPRPRIWSY